MRILGHTTVNVPFDSNLKTEFDFIIFGFIYVF